MVGLEHNIHQYKIYTAKIVYFQGKTKVIAKDNLRLRRFKILEAFILFLSCEKVLTNFSVSQYLIFTETYPPHE